MSYIYDIFVSIDQFGNTLAGGNPDNSISARVGYFSKHAHSNFSKGYWRNLARLIDFTFWPVDGKDHCHRAYHSNAGHEFPKKWKRWVLFILSILVGASCFVLFVPFWLFWIPRIFIPFKDNRILDLNSGLKGTERKLAGVQLLLEEHQMSNADSEEIAKRVIAKSKEVHEMM